MDRNVFVDTMVFLHFRPLDELDLRVRTSADEITLVVPRVTLRELDKHKSSHPNRKVRERARRVLTEIETAITTKQPLKGGIEVELFLDHPKDQLEQLHLNPDWADDVLIASVIAYRDGRRKDDIVVITQDTGPRLTCLHHGIKTVELDDSVALPEELDYVERENRTLQKQLQRLQNALPRLEAAFLDADSPDNVANFLLSPHQVVEEKAIAGVLAELRERYPKKAVPGVVGSADPIAESLRNINVMARLDPKTVSPEQLIAYNAEFDDFYAKSEMYLREVHAYRELRNRTISFTIEVRNSGTAPADDVDVKFHFPDGFRLMAEGDLPGAPEEPSPPQGPLSQVAQLARGLDFAQEFMGWQPAFPKPGLPSLFRIDETGSYVVTDHFRRIKHGIPAVLPKMYVEFPSLAEAKSFKCTYELRPANLPDPVIGEMHFVVRIDDSNLTLKTEK